MKLSYGCFWKIIFKKRTYTKLLIKYKVMELNENNCFE